MKNLILKLEQYLTGTNLIVLSSIYYAVYSWGQKLNSTILVATSSILFLVFFILGTYFKDIYIPSIKKDRGIPLESDEESKIMKLWSLYGILLFSIMLAFFVLGVFGAIEGLYLKDGVVHTSEQINNLFYGIAITSFAPVLLLVVVEVFGIFGALIDLAIALFQLMLPYLIIGIFLFSMLLFFFTWLGLVVDILTILLTAIIGIVLIIGIIQGVRKNRD